MTDRPLTDEDHAPLSDAEMDRYQSHAEMWREMHDVAPEELMDIDVLLTEARRARAEASRLRAENTALAAAVDQFRSFPDNPGPGNWSASYRMGYADAGRDARAITRALGLVQDGEGQADA